jgi:hypothetical protein
MPVQKYALVRGEEKKLVTSWDFGWNNIHIDFDEKEIGTIANRKELQAGQTFTLPDKSKLEVNFQNSIFSSGLILKRNGIPIPDSVTDPMTSIKASWQIALIVAIYNLIIGIVFAANEFDTPYMPNFGLITAVIGVAYLILSLIIKKKSLPALIGFMVLFSIETLLEAATNYSFFVLIKAAIIYYLFQGIWAFKKIKEEDSEQIPMISE